MKIVNQKKEGKEKNFFILKLSNLFKTRGEVVRSDDKRLGKDENYLERRTENNYVRMMKISCQEKHLKTSINETSLNRANEECLNASNGYVEMNFRWKHMFYVNQYYL